jgi:hypothetical protein
MKVLVANDLYGRSSAAGVAVRLAEGVAARGIETTLLATVQKKDQARRFRENGVDVRWSTRHRMTGAGGLGGVWTIRRVSRR